MFLSNLDVMRQSEKVSLTLKAADGKKIHCEDFIRLTWFRGQAHITS